MAIPITTDLPPEVGGTSVIKDLDGNFIVKKADLPAMTVRQGTVSPDTWAMLASKAAPTPAVPDIGVIPTTPTLPPSVKLPEQMPIKYGVPTSDAGGSAGGGMALQAPPQPQASPMNPMAGFGLGTSPKLAAMQERAFGDAKKANAELADIEMMRSTEEAAAKRRADNAIQRQEAAAQTQRDYLSNQLELSERTRNQAIEQARTMKVDSGRLMRGKGAGEKVGLFLASILGGIGGGITGRENAAFAAIDRAVEHDIDDQKSEVMNARENVNMHNNVVAQMRAKGLDFDQSVLAAKQIKLEQLKRHMDTLASEYKGPETMARAASFNANMDEKLAELKIQQDNVAKARALAMMEKLAAHPGTGKQLNESVARNLGEANGAVTNAQELLKKFNGKAEGVGGWLMSFLPMTDASRYGDRAQVAAQVVGTYLEGGKLSDANVPMYRAMLPTPGDSKETARNKVDAIVKAVATRQAAEKSALQNSGYNVSGIKDAAPKINFTPGG